MNFSKNWYTSSHWHKKDWFKRYEKVLHRHRQTKQSGPPHSTPTKTVPRGQKINQWTDWWMSKACCQSFVRDQKVKWGFLGWWGARVKLSCSFKLSTLLLFCLCYVKGPTYFQVRQSTSNWLCPLVGWSVFRSVGW